MYDQLVMLISNVGFPIAVSLYLLLRIEKKLEELTKALNSLHKTILSAIEHQKDEYFTRK
ncbi:YvrJ family protein [Clostridium sporogenes]|uniref:YvrJ family protein n=1 Tax=Clostridium sporogenes TaxID=1509 RepID=UPI000667B6D7|nr:YvrJ family protein [Clostridium sporogenes]